uniref:Regulatory protein zeste n=1 Tax=Phlebotomus papatasi TaxID=29031 RepID=A0A1B0D5C7_PHLPP
AFKKVTSAQKEKLVSLLETLVNSNPNKVLGSRRSWGSTYYWEHFSRILNQMDESLTPLDIPRVGSDWRRVWYGMNRAARQKKSMIKVRQAQNLTPLYTLSDVEERILVLWNGPGWNWMKEKKSSTQGTQGQSTAMEPMEVTQTQPNNLNHVEQRAQQQFPV